MLREPWRTRLLFASVAANLFAAALIGAHFAMRPPRPLGGGPPRPELVIDRMAHDLAPDDAARFRGIMRERLPELEASRRRMEQARAAMAGAIGQASYDEGAVRQAMKAWQDAWMAMSDDLSASMLRAIAGLSPEGRRRLAEAGVRHPRP